MLGTKYQELWRAAIRHAFPAGDGTRKQVAVLVEAVRKFRNRLAHHDSVLAVDIPFEVSRVHSLAALCGPAIAAWLPVCGPHCRGLPDTTSSPGRHSCGECPRRMAFLRKAVRLRLSIRTLIPSRRENRVLRRPGSQGGGPLDPCQERQRGMDGGTRRRVGILTRSTRPPDRKSDPDVSSEHMDGGQLSSLLAESACGTRAPLPAPDPPAPGARERVGLRTATSLCVAARTPDRDDHRRPLTPRSRPAVGVPRPSSPTRPSLQRSVRSGR